MNLTPQRAGVTNDGLSPQGSGALIARRISITDPRDSYIPISTFTNKSIL
jgi:hypothetical protein